MADPKTPPNTKPAPKPAPEPEPAAETIPAPGNEFSGIPTNTPPEPEDEGGEPETAAEKAKKE